MAAVRLNRTEDSTDNHLRVLRARMDTLVHLRPVARVGTGVVVRRRHLVVGSRVLDSDPEADSILPKGVMDNPLDHLAGAVVTHQDTEGFQN